MKKDLSEDVRRAVFVSLVEAQDGGARVKDSRAMTATKHNITVEQVKKIEQEGLDKGWPPL